MKISLSETLNLFSQTLPFFFIRALLLMGFGFFTLISVFLLFFLLHTAKSRDAFLDIILLAICSGLYGLILRFFLKHLLFKYKMAYVVYASRILSFPQSLPNGTSQIKTGKDLIRKKCTDISTLFSVRSYLHQVLKKLFLKQKKITSREKNSGDLFPGALLGLWAGPGFPYLKETILSFAVNRDDERFSISLKKAVAFVQANPAQWMRMVCRTGQIDMAGNGVFFLLAFLPAALLFSHFSISLWGATLLALIQGFILKQIFLFPILQMNMIQHFVKSVRSAHASSIPTVPMVFDLDIVDIDG